MMISPEAYYEMELKGNSLQEIQKEIESLKNEITELRKSLEDYEQPMEDEVDPDRLTRIKCDRKYLEKAIQAYEEAGGTYIPSEEEKKSKEFDEGLKDLHILRFSIGGFFEGHTVRTYTVIGDKVMMEEEHFPIEESPVPSEYEPWPAEAFIEELKNLHIGEWKQDYMNPYVLDGTQWSLEIEYSNDRTPVEISGSNAFPYNFDDFMELLGMDQ